MKDPAMLFYTADFLTGVQLMGMKERGQYITLLCLQQQRGHMTQKEMEKAVGKMSGELLSKFIRDDDGKLYNKRADYEIKRREARSQRQRENVERRWNIPNSDSGSLKGNTMVLPLETATVIETEKEDISGVTGEKGPGERSSQGDPELGRVMTLYCNRVSLYPSATCIELIKGYTVEMGADVVCHAIDKALDDHKREWSYIWGILRSYHNQGIKSLDDVFREERAHQKRTDAKRPGNKPPSDNTAATADELDRMKATLAKIRGESP